MKDQIELLDLLERAEHQRTARRSFIRLCGGAAAMTGGLSLLAACDDADEGPGTPFPTPTPSPTAAPITDVDVLNFALQLEYLEANYYSYATTGAGIASGLQTGTGTQGTVATGSGAGAARQVGFTDQIVAQYAREIAADEVAHVTFLRTQLGGQATAQPALNLSGSTSVAVPSGTATGAFTAAAVAAGIDLSATGGVFDPYLNDENFLIGSYLLTDVGVSAYRGSARLLTNKTFIEASAGILSTEAYHDAVIRSELWRRGLTTPSIYTRITQISNARDALDGPTDTDQDIGTAAVANLVPTDANGSVLGRTAPQVLNVVYQNRTAVAQGGFFPAGVNGSIRTSGAN